MSGNTRSSMSSSSMEHQIKNPTRKNNGTRSSEISNPMRRSFSGNPFGKPSGVAVPRGFNPVTPANSPSAFPRSSIDKSSKSIDRGFEEKENEMDRFLKQSKVDSPGLMKPTKHFMSPTISAVSKINASPRKKILAEKNELTRSLWGSSNVCEEGDAARSEVEASESHEQTVTDSSSSISRNSSMKKVAFDSEVQVIPPIDPHELSGQEEAENKAEKSPHIKSPHSPLAPLDADPLMTPYDPDTNYLSPRPQFLHYCPTPRIKHFLGEETDGHSLNDSIDFVEGLSETELTEETSSDDSSREPQNDVLEGVDKELKDDAEVVFTTDDEKIDVVGSIVIEKEEADARDVVPAEVSELTFVAGDDSDDLEVTTTDEMEATEEVPVENGKENVTEAKQASKGLHLFTKSKFCALILAVLVAGMVMGGVHSPIASSGVGISKDWRLYKIVQEAEIGEYVKMNVDVVAQNFGCLYDDSLDHIFSLISKLRGESELCGMNYHNLSSMQEDSVFRKDTDSYLLLDNQNHERNVVESWLLHGPEADCLDEEDESGNEEDNDSFEDSGREAEERLVDADIAGKTLMPLLVEETKQEESDLDAFEREFLEKFEIDMRNKSIEESPGIQENTVERTEIESGDEWVEDDKPATAQSHLKCVQPAAEFQVESLEVEKDEETKQEESDLDAIEREFLEMFEIDMRNEMIEESAGIKENTIERTEIESGDEWAKDDKPATAQSRLECVQPAAEFQVESLEVEKDDLKPDYMREEPLAFIAVGVISMLVLTLVTFTGLMYFKPKEAAVVAPPSSKEQQPWKLKKFDISPTYATNMEEHHSQLWQKKHASSSCPTEVDVTGESCPSEMSSYPKKSFKSEGRERAGGEIQSRDKRHKRESLESSSDFSTGSPSYGSFTTYEKIPLKHRNGEEEVVITPIRRSSRLLKQVTSP